MGSITRISGAGGGGGGGSQHTPVEAPNTLQNVVKGRILDLIAYGPIFGLADGLKSVYLDSTPVENEDGTKNFDGITVETREGYPDQSMIPGFRAVENSIEVGTDVLFDSPPVRTVSNDNADAVLVTVQFSALVAQRDNGDTVGTSVTVYVDVKAGDGAWREAVNKVVSGKTTSPYPVSMRVELPDGEGPYQVRVRRGSKESQSSKVQNKCTWTLLTEIVDARFSYPNMALVGLTVNSKLFGNQMPPRSYDMKLSIIDVPSNYNPETRQYTGIWNGTFKKAWTDNPAWAFRDLAIHPVIGAGIENVDKWELYRIAQYCDQLVPDGYGGMEPRFTINTIFAEQEDATTALNTLASIFRGMAYWGTNTMVAVADMPSTPVKLVAPANVVDGEFEYSGTSLRDRHSVCVVMWNDPNDEGKAVPEVYEDPESIAEFGWRETRVTAVGCNSRGQARRLAKWILYSERMETQTVKYRATLDHADLRPGDIIELADPDYQGARMGGRISVPHRSSPVLDKVPDAAVQSMVGTWYLKCVMPDGTIHQSEVSTFDGNTVNLLLPFPYLPIAGAVWALTGTSLVLPQFRVAGVTEDEGSLYTITATEYDPRKYDIVEQGLKLPDLPTSMLPTGPVMPPMNLSFESYKYLAGSGEHQGLTISWTASDDVRVENYILDAMAPDQAGFSTVYSGPGLAFDMKDVSGGEWTFRLRAVATSGTPSTWVSRTVQIATLLLPVPPDSVKVTVKTFEIVLSPVSSYPDQLWEFWRSDVALTTEEIETNAISLPTGTYLVDVGLRANRTYFYYVRGTNNYGKSAWFGTQGTTLNDFEDTIGAITDEIKTGQLYEYFNSEIAQKAAAAAEVVVNEALDQVNTEILAVKEDLATSVSALQAQITDALDALEYVAEKAYEPKDVVRLGQKLYSAKIAVPAAADGTNAPPNATYWTDVGQIAETAEGMAARLSTVETAVTELDGEVTAQAGQLDGLTSELNGKANASALDSLTTRVTSVEGTLTSQGQSITSLNSKLSGLGGENLLPNSSFEETTPGDSALARHWNASGTSTTWSLVPSPLAQSTNAQRVTGTAIAPGGAIRLVQVNTGGAAFCKVRAGATYVLSAYVRGKAGTTCEQVIQFFDINNAIIQISTSVAVPHTEATFSRLVMTAVAPANAVAARVFPARTNNTGSVAADLWLEVDNVQLQEGTGATAYTPSVSQTAAALSEATAALTSRVTAAEGALTSQSSSITNLGNKIDGLGGDNLLPNSSFEELATGSSVRAKCWTGYGPAIVPSPLAQSAVAQRVSRLATPAAAWADLYQINTDGVAFPAARAGATYVLSAYIRGTAGFRITQYIQFFDSTGTLVSSVGGPNGTATETFDRYTMTAVAPANAVSVRVYAGRITNQTAAAADLWMEVDNVQLQEGSVATAYAPSVEQSAIAASAAIAALSSTVTSQGATISSLSSSVTSLTNTVAGKADSSAVTALTNRVTTAENTITAQGNSITKLQSGLSGTELDPAPGALWHFDSTVEGWTAGNATLAASAGYVTLTATAADPTMTRGGISVSGALYSRIRAKIKRTAGASSSWDGTAYYTTASHGITGSYCDKITNPVLAIGDSAVVEWDMAALYAGGTDWVTNTILSIRLDFGAVAGDAFQIEWVAIGRLGVPASSSAVNSLDTRVTSVEGINTSQASSITSLTSRMGTAESTLTTTASTVSTLNSMTTMWGVKIAQASNGKYYNAGMGINMTTTGGVTQSEILFQADRLALINVSTGGIATPFVIDAGVTYISSAMIKNASITNAKIGGVIQSDVLDSYGRPLWSLNKDGSMELNSTSSTYRRDLRANYDRYWYLPSGVLVIEIGELS